MKRNLRKLAALTALAMACLMGVATRTHAQTLTTGTISGTVTDANGSKLSGVQITVDSGQMDVTNASGYFIITDVLPGTHSVEASLVGYQPVKATNVIVTQEQVTTVTLQLAKRNVQRAATTVVQVPLVRKNVTPTIYTVTSKEEQLVRSQPNNLYQYPGALISQPGVVPDADGYPTIRGSKIDEVNYMVDGIPITSPLDNGFATNLVTVGMDRMNVYTGGYRAELGSAIGGVVNAVIKTGASIRGAAVEATTGSWDYSGVVYEQGNVEKNGFNWYVSGNFFRTAYEKNSQLDELPASADVIAKFVQPVGKGRVSFLYNQGFERYLFPVDDPLTGRPWGESEPGANDGVQGIHTKVFNQKTNMFEDVPAAQDYSPQQYNIQSLTYSMPLSQTANLSLQGYRLEHFRQIHEASPYNAIDYFDDSDQGAGRLDYSNQLSERLQLRLGGEYIHTKSFNQIVGLPEIYVAGPGINIIRGAMPTDDMNLYLSTTVKPSSRITADLGVRYDSRVYHRQATSQELGWGQASIEAADRDIFDKYKNDKLSAVTPRGGMTYSLSPKTILKVSGGRFIQMPATLWVEQLYRGFADQPDRENGDSGNAYARARRKEAHLKPQISDGIDVGIETQLNNYLGLSLTPYYRKIKQEVVRGGVVVDGEVDPNLGNAYQSLGHGHVRGIETKLQMRERKGLSGWITYTLQSGKNNSPGAQAGTTLASVALIPDEEHRNNYDQKHTIYVVGNYAKGRFEINPMLELGSGYPFGGEQGDWVDPNTEEADPAYGVGRDGTKWPILVNGKLQDWESVNKYNTGWHKNLSVTFRLYTDTKKSSYYFVQVQNITRSEDVTSRYLLDPTSGAFVGPHVGETTYTDAQGNQQTATGYYEYKPYTRIPPVFVLVGVHKTF